MTWSIAALAHEAFKNLGVRHAVHFLILLLIFAALGTLVGHQGQRSLAQEYAARQGGSLVWIVRANENDSLSVGSCLELGSVDGVDAVGGALKRSPRLTLDAVRGSAVPAILVTPGALHVWSEAVVTGGSWVGSDLERLGAASIGTMLVDEASGSQLTVGGRVPSQIPLDRLHARVVVAAAPVEPLAECWVRFSPSTVQHGHGLLAYAFGSTDASISRHLHNPVHVDGPREQWVGLTGIHPWLVAGILCAVAGALFTLGRRQELAIYQVFGTSRAQVATMLIFETVIVALPAAILSLTASFVLVAVIHDGFLASGVALAQSFEIASAGLVLLALTPIATVAAASGDVTSRLKDR